MLTIISKDKLYGSQYIIKSGFGLYQVEIDGNYKLDNNLYIYYFAVQMIDYWFVMKAPQ